MIVQLDNLPVIVFVSGFTFAVNCFLPQHITKEVDDDDKKKSEKKYRAITVKPMLDYS